MDTVTIKNLILKSVAPIFYRTKPLRERMIRNSEVLHIRREQMRYLTHSTFNVAVVEVEGRRFFFRECRRHLKSKQYISMLLDDYFQYVHPIKDSVELKKEILGYLDRPHNLRKFMNMGVKNDPQSSVAKFFEKHESAVVGMPSRHSELLEEELEGLIQFVWGEIYLYQLSRLVCNNEYQTFNSNRQISTFLLAEHFGVSNLIPSTEYIQLVIDGNDRKVGTIMQEAPGVSPESLTICERHTVNPILQKHFMNLNFLDVICRQTDHRPGHDGNYNVTVNGNGELDGVCAFDNDAPTTFLLSTNVGFSTSAKTTSIIKKNQDLDRLYASFEMAEKILVCKNKDIKCLLDEYLTPLQIYYINARIKKLRTTIVKSEKAGTLKLLKDCEWNAKTLQNELQYCRDGKCVTYLYAMYEMLY